MQDDEWMTVDEIATAVKVDVQTVRRWLRSGDLPGRNLGGKAGWRVRRRDYEAFMGKRERSSSSEHPNAY